MKRLFFLIFLIFIIPPKGRSAESNLFRADTIRIDYKSFLIEVASSNIKDYSLTDANIPGLVGGLLKALENVTINSTNKSEQIVIRYSNLFDGLEQEYYELNLETKQKTTDRMIIHKSEVLKKAKGNIVLEFENCNYFIRIYLEDIMEAENLLTSEFSEIILNADSEIPVSKKRLNGWLILNREGSFNTFFLNEIPPLTKDMLELTAGIGSGWIKNEFVGDFHFRIGLCFANKGMLRNKYFAEVEAFYDFPEDGRFVNNGFLSVGYERNFSNEPGKDKWYGLSVGYLFDKNNDFFKKNTFKLAVNKRLNNSFSVLPEIYFNGFLKNMFPGVRFNVSF